MRLFIFCVLVVIIALFFVGRSRFPDLLSNHFSKKLGVSTTIGSFSLGMDKNTIKDLQIGNPPRFSLPKAFSAQDIELKAPLLHFFKNPVEIEEIIVDDIYLGLEFISPSGTAGNWSQILNHYQNKAKLAETDGKKVFIKKLVFTNIRAELLFQSAGQIRQLPLIRRIELHDISTEGGVPTDQLLGSILGQMLREVFIEYHLNDLIKGLFLDTPNKALDSFLTPFKGLFNKTLDTPSELKQPA